MPEAIKYTAHDVAEAVAMYEEKGSVSAIVAAFGGSHSTWSRRLRLAGVDVKRHQPARTRQIVAQRMAGESYATIAARHGISRQRVFQICANAERGMTESQQRRKEALEMYAAGVPLKKIMAEFGYSSERTLMAVAHRWAVRRPSDADARD